MVGAAASKLDICGTAYGVAALVVGALALDKLTEQADGYKLE